MCGSTTLFMRLILLVLKQDSNPQLLVYSRVSGSSNPSLGKIYFFLAFGDFLKVLNILE